MIKSEIRNKSFTVLSTAYLAPVQYYTKIISHDEVLIEKFENYSKQSYRNRCVIYAANGPLTLAIPIKKSSSDKTIITDIKIDYTTYWQKNHLRSIESAYNSSPFYQYYIDDLVAIYNKQHAFLIDFNSELQNAILKLIKVNKHIGYTKEYIKSYNEKFADFRNAIHPKKRMQVNDVNFSPKEYYQVFAEKFGFIPNLSIIDLLFNAGIEAMSNL